MDQLLRVIRVNYSRSHTQYIHGVCILYGFMLFFLLLLDYYTYYHAILVTFHELCGQKMSLDRLEALSLIWNILILWVSHLYYSGGKILLTAMLWRSYN